MLVEAEQGKGYVVGTGQSASLGLLVVRVLLPV